MGFEITIYSSSLSIKNRETGFTKYIKIPKGLPSSFKVRRVTEEMLKIKNQVSG
jgi:hypothetical protein